MSDIKIEINGTPLELNAFTHEVIESTIRGLLSPLRGYEKKGDISIVIKNGGDTEI